MTRTYVQDGKTALQIAEEKECSADGERSHTPKKGMLTKLKDWWQKNKREINLVSLCLTTSLRFSTLFTFTDKSSNKWISC